MNNARLVRIKQAACAYAKSETGFANRSVTAIEETNPCDDVGGTCYVVRMILSHSPEDIERIIAKGDPAEATLTREFLKGDFQLRLVLSGEKVVDSQWEDMDVC